MSKQVAKGGRPKFEITDKIIKQVETLAAQGLSQEQIGSVIGCSKATIERTNNRNEGFEAAIKRGRQKGIAKVTNALFKKAMDGDNIAMIFYLKNRDRDNWKDKQSIEHTSPEGVQFNMSFGGKKDDI